MYRLTVTLHHDEELVKEQEFSFKGELAAQWLMEQIDSMADDDVDAIGQVVTPLPPNKIHSAQGIVTPKPPLQVRREQRDRVTDLPDDYKDDDNIWFDRSDT
jgi:hypothetical protein